MSCENKSSNLTPGHAMAQTFSHWPRTVEAWFHAQVTPCEIYGGRSGTVTSFSSSSSVFTCKYCSTMAPYSCITWGMNSTSDGGHSVEAPST
jgi:hypothetical protein